MTEPVAEDRPGAREAGVDPKAWVGLAIAGLAVTLFFAGCSRGGRPSVLLTSPSADGRFRAEVDVNRRANDRPHYLCLRVTIRDGQGNVLAVAETGASSRQRWRLAWDEANRLWLYSADRGTSYWERGNAGWAERLAAPGSISPRPPEEIRLEMERAAASRH